ncbi:CmpA/NrtA family ABC transporter substrate-binding protein [Solirhodobacter olei]|uniref:CmpA/NrtA family ABC transporter substrate-binding protein n=1 Tax=Solirhodobacter olei TaxID=2493082 RepID=UPI000FDC1989|nr:CmpA/NrtA family ABC transporter substrate-binding protein [Solirhodobacter olei]
MSGVVLPLGFIPLVDAAPLIVAQELGFAEEERLTFELRRAASWSMLRDMLSFGQVAAAHMLAPVPVATALGLGGGAGQLDALQVLSVNGNVIGVSRALAARMREAGHGFDFADAAAAGRALIAAAGEGLRIGVPFPFSMHAELLYYWLGALGFRVPQDLAVRTVPPPQMAAALATDEIDAFCVGEPWGSIAVATGAGDLLLPGSAIWSFAPEKVLATRHDWAEREPEVAGRLMRAIWRAGRWLGDPANRITASEILARPQYLDLPAEVPERGLAGDLVISPEGAEAQVPGFLEFHAGLAAFPWRSQAAWIGARMAARLGLDRNEALEAARAVFRSDLYRRNLAGAGAEMPATSDKVEGGAEAPILAAGGASGVILPRNRFFDGGIFDPAPGS